MKRARSGFALLHLLAVLFLALPSAALLIALPSAALLIALPSAALLIALPSAAMAEKYPSRPIRVMLPFAAGSVSDVTLRILADKLGTRLGASIVVENQPRAGGTTAALAAKMATPDGYTLVTFSSSTAISVSLLKALPYDPVADFMPISGISTFANIIAVNAGSNYRTLPDLLGAARERPGALNIGTTTVGSTNHLAANLLKSMTGLSIVIVPFRTPGDLLTAVLRNDVDAIVQSYGALKSAVESNQIRALGITTPKRTAYTPNVPTVDEAGVTGFDVVTWHGAFAPTGTPPEVIGTLNREMRAALADPALSRCRPRRTSFPGDCGPKSANGAVSSAMPASSNNDSSMWEGLPLRPETG